MGREPEEEREGEMTYMSRLAEYFVDQVRRDGREMVDMMGGVRAAAESVIEDEKDAGIPSSLRSHVEIVAEEIEAALSELPEVSNPDAWEALDGLGDLDLGEEFE